MKNKMNGCYSKFFVKLVGFMVIEKKFRPVINAVRK